MEMTVTLGNHTIHGVELGTDTYTDMALAHAREFQSRFGNVTDAIVDRFDGLVVYYDTMRVAAGQVRGCHFVTAICGYSGSGPITASMILELFGFGDQRELLEQICHGGNDAQFHFRKGVGLVSSGRSRSA